MLFGKGGGKGGDPKTPEILRCSFCNKTQYDVRKFIAGPSSFICNECVEVCNDIIADDGRAGGLKEQLVEPPESKPDSTRETLTVTLRCALCKLPVFTSDALAVEARGPLCPGCVDAIQAALAERDTPQ